MKRTAFFLLALIALAVGASAQAVAIGGTLDNFTLADSNGKSQSFNDLKGKGGTVVIFVSTQCPVVRGYNERMNQIAMDYKAKGINVIGVNANVTESAETVKEHSALTYKFPVLVDRQEILADRVGPRIPRKLIFLTPKMCSCITERSTTIGQAAVLRKVIFETRLMLLWPVKRSSELTSKRSAARSGGTWTNAPKYAQFRISG